MPSSSSRRLALFSAAFAAASLGSVALAFPGATLYTPPSSEPFVEYQGETDVAVNDSSGSISTAQNAINSARTANPSAILIITLSGIYTVTGSPLTLGSNECLVLASGTVIQASSSASAGSLISVNGASDVGISGGTLNANSRNMDCISATACNRVQIDDVTAENSELDNILVSGNGDTSWDNEIAVTRCTCTGGTGGHYGISVKDATQAVVIDNTCSNNTGGGIYIASCSHCTFTNNTCSSNSIDGIHLQSGDHNFISDNECDTDPTDIYLNSSGTANVIASNHAYYATTVGINETGSGGDTFFENYYKGNASNFTSSGSGNHHMAYKAPVSDPNDDYFYPPISSNQHTTTTIVNGLGRYDLTIGSASLGDGSGSVLSQYTTARSNNPNSVIVLHLTGTYTVGANPLTLQSNTCVLLTGTINESSSTSAAAIINCASGATHISFSGGTINGQGESAAEAIDFTGASMAWVQGCTLENFGTTEVNNGVIVLHSEKGPAMASSNTITTAAGRGIWTESAGPFVITDNVISGCQMDGVDCDYETGQALVKLNTLNSNVRYGVFFEQGAQYNVGIGNGCSTGLTRGFNIFDNDLSTPTLYNVAACNVCNADGNGLKSGAGGGNNATTSHNFFFDNTATNNTGDGIDSAQTGTQNYYSQTILGGNGTDISTSGAEAFFNPTPP